MAARTRATHLLDAFGRFGPAVLLVYIVLGFALIFSMDSLGRAAMRDLEISADRASEVQAAARLAAQLRRIEGAATPDSARSAYSEHLEANSRLQEIFSLEAGPASSTLAVSDLGAVAAMYSQVAAHGAQAWERGDEAEGHRAIHALASPLGESLSDAATMASRLADEQVQDSVAVVIQNMGRRSVGAQGFLAVGSILVSLVALAMLRYRRSTTAAEAGVRLAALDRVRAETAEAAERRSSARVRAILQHSADLVTVLDAKGFVSFTTEAANQILGYDEDYWIGRPIREFIHPDDHGKVRGLMVHALRAPAQAVRGQLRGRWADGSWHTLEFTLSNLLHLSDVRGIVATARDVSERESLERQLAHQALHDRLTGLPNRSLFDDRLRHAVAGAARGSSAVGVLLLDVDGLRSVNDLHGQSVGDSLLSSLGSRLRACVRPSDTVARLGGDEFAVILTGAFGESEARVIAERILDWVRMPVVVDGRSICATGSVGVAIRVAGEGNADDVFARAEIALDSAKRAGGDGAAFFDTEMGQRAWERNLLERDMRGAVERGEIRVLYQPIVSLDSGEVVEAEALVRWVHPERGTVSPADFIPAAEESGLIVEIGESVLRAACNEAMRWPKPAVVSVNLSPRQLAHPAIAQAIARALADSGLPPARLKLEVTETAMADERVAAAALQALKRLGVRIAIDDFGTGYSSLSYLQGFPVDVLKIDRSFVSRMTESEDSLYIVEAIVALAKNLRLSITGEGIETAEQREMLTRLGVDLGQGYLFSRPIAAEDFRALLSAPAPAAA